MAEQQARQVVFAGRTAPLSGTARRVGEPAPEFTVVDTDLQEHHLRSTHGRVRIISVVPSVDTSVCSVQTRRFDEEGAKLPEDVAILTVSMDLPFAQRRWCGAADAGNVHALSDHRHASFGQAYGTLVKENRLLSRAVFVVDSDARVLYVEYVPEVTQHPNYEAALAALRAGEVDGRAVLLPAG